MLKSDDCICDVLSRWETYVIPKAFRSSFLCFFFFF